MNRLKLLISKYRPVLLGVFVAFALIKFITVKSNDSLQTRLDSIFNTTVPAVFSIENPYEKPQPFGQPRAHGTGVIVETKTKRKMILTNRHVCLAIQNMFAANLVRITNDFAGGHTQIVYKDESQDLCLLDLPDDLKITPIKLAKTDVRRNEIVYVVGYPIWHNVTLTWGTVISGATVDVNRPYTGQTCKTSWQTQQGQDMCVTEENLIDLTVPVETGSSGSPVVNSDNELVGLIVVTEPESNYGSMIDRKEIERVLNKF